MTREQIQQAITRLSADDRARLRAWLDAYDGEREPRPAEATAGRLGRLAGRTFAGLRRRVQE